MRTWRIYIYLYWYCHQNGMYYFKLAICVRARESSKLFVNIIIDVTILQI